jgi:2-amino-4-hydroxy-6-hydroxymethyldihydropteridine diphosphokinase
MKHKVYLALGSNLGDREAIIQEAIRLIGERVGTVASQSSFIETEPWGFESQNTFLNGAILVETTLTPHEVLAATQQIERDLGKTDVHATRRSLLPVYKDRPIDIDILLYDDLHLREPDLTLPHPLMHERPFVMQPLREIMKTP